jgi:hypothetical protein
MILCKDWTYIYVCPVTKERLFRNDVFYSSGICPRCGHDDESTICHEEKVVGKWTVKPSWIDRVFRKKKQKFYTKEEIEKIEHPEECI